MNYHELAIGCWHQAETIESRPTYIDHDKKTNVLLSAIFFELGNMFNYLNNRQITKQDVCNNEN